MTSLTATRRRSCTYLQSVGRLAPRARVAGDDGEPRPVELPQQRHDRLGDLRVARYRPRERRVLRGAVGDFGVAAFLQTNEPALMVHVFVVC